MVEGPLHIKAKLALVQILKEEGYDTEVEQEWPQFMEWGYTEYQADIVAKKDGRIYFFEIDGKVGHGTKITIPQDEQRDKRFYTFLGIVTVRFNPGDIVGRKAHPRKVILAEIEYRKWYLRNKYMKLKQRWSDVKSKFSS